MPSPWEVLGVAPESGPDARRAAYRRLVREHHPDTHPDADAHEAEAHAVRLREVMDAWALLEADVTPAPASAGVRAEPDPETVWVAGADIDLSDDPRGDPSFGRTVAPPRPGAVLVPVALFAAAVGVFALSVVMGMTFLWQLAVVLFVVALASFALTPFFVMLRRR